MKIAVNFRSFVHSMIVLIATVLSCLLALNIPWLGFSLLLITLFVPVGVVVALRKRTPTYKIATVFLTALLSFIAIVFFFITVYTWVPSEIDSGVYYVSGHVEDNYVSDGTRVVVLKDLKLDKTSVSGRMKITVDDQEKFFGLIPVGDKLEFVSYVSVRELVSGYEVNASYLRSDIRYSAWINASSVTVSEGAPTLLDKINTYVKNTLIECMGNRYGVIAYGILSGDKNEISSSIRDSFSAAGIAHVLAVSGLHIGFLMMIVTFVLSKLKVRKVPSFIVNAIILLLYCTFAGFSPSVIRASIMFLVGTGAMLLGEEKDSLNSLGFAATGILTFSPFMLFEAGFIMSVGAVFGIINFSPAITQGLKKIKLPEKIAQAIAVSCSAQLGITPACIAFFGNLQLYSIIINVFLMPLMSVVFIAVFVTLVLSVIPLFKFLVTISGFLIKGLIIVADFCAALPFAQISIASSVAAFGFYPLYFVMGNYLYCKRKGLVASICVAVIVVMLIILLII